jgi:hypothetical protein
VWTREVSRHVPHHATHEPRHGPLPHPHPHPHIRLTVLLFVSLCVWQDDGARAARSLSRERSALAHEADNDEIMAHACVLHVEDLETSRRMAVTHEGAEGGIKHLTHEASATQSRRVEESRRVEQSRRVELTHLGTTALPPLPMPLRAAAPHTDAQAATGRRFSDIMRRSPVHLHVLLFTCLVLPHILCPPSTFLCGFGRKVVQEVPSHGVLAQAGSALVVHAHKMSCTCSIYLFYILYLLVV